MSMRWMAASVFLLALGTAACGVPTNSPEMLPGENCLSCHQPYGQAYKRPWTAGGTVYDNSGTPVEGAEVLIVDANNNAVTMISNGMGNFYTAETLQSPFTKVSIGYHGKWQEMPKTAPVKEYEAKGEPSGACNYCHNADPSSIAGLRITVPQ